MKLTRSEIMETVSNEHNNRSCERFCSLENAGCQFSVIKAVMVSQHITYGWLPKGEGTKACRRIVESPYGTTLRAPETRRKIKPFCQNNLRIFECSIFLFLSLLFKSVVDVGAEDKQNGKKRERRSQIFLFWLFCVCGWSKALWRHAYVTVGVGWAM